MICLCCGKEIREKESEYEKSVCWHKRCIKGFFGVNELPELDISEEKLIQLVKESTNRGFTIPGVQKKLSLHLTAEFGRSHLTMVDYPTGYILKPQSEGWTALPEAEHLVMQMARATGINTVPFALLNLHGKRAYITKRVDRVLPFERKNSFQMLAMEDFCQLDWRLTEDKYRGSYERCAKIITRYSVQNGMDLSELFLRLVFCFVSGNSDMHLKNFSLIETSAESGMFILAPAYDLIPVNVVMPEDTEQMALTINGKKRNIHKRDFLKFADAIDIPKMAAEKMIHKILLMKETYLQLCMESYLPEPMKEQFACLIEQRMQALDTRQQ